MLLIVSHKSMWNIESNRIRNFIKWYKQNLCDSRATFYIGENCARQRETDIAETRYNSSKVFGSFLIPQWPDVCCWFLYCYLFSFCLHFISSEMSRMMSTYGGKCVFFIAFILNMLGLRSMLAFAFFRIHIILCILFLGFVVYWTAVDLLISSLLHFLIRLFAMLAILTLLDRYILRCTFTTYSSTYSAPIHLLARRGICGPNIVNWTHGQCNGEPREANDNVAFDHSVFEKKRNQQGFRTYAKAKSS